MGSRMRVSGPVEWESHQMRQMLGSSRCLRRAFAVLVGLQCQTYMVHSIFAIISPRPC